MLVYLVFKETEFDGDDLEKGFASKAAAEAYVAQFDDFEDLWGAVITKRGKRVSGSHWYFKQESAQEHIDKANADTTLPYHWHLEGPKRTNYNTRRMVELDIQ